MKPYYPPHPGDAPPREEERKGSLLAIPAVIYTVVLIIISLFLLALFFRILPFLILIWIIIAFLSLIIGLFVALFYLAKSAPQPGPGNFSLSMVRDPSKQDDDESGPVIN